MKINKTIEDLELTLTADVKRIAAEHSALHIVINKTQQVMHVYAMDWTLLKTYPMTAFSGGPGPKHQEGDMQIPEGVYRCTALNPQSSFHLSIRLDYPNLIDQRYNGENPGSDIYIHGGAATIGCIPIGDQAIEELFYVIEGIGLDHVDVAIYSEETRDQAKKSAYVTEVYAELQQHLGEFLSRSRVVPDSK